MGDPKDRDSQQNQLQVLAAVFGAAAGYTTSLLTDPAGGLIVGAAATEAAKMAIERYPVFVVGRSLQCGRSLHGGGANP